MKIERAALVGGIHGNELTGVYLLKKFQRFPQLIQRKTFKIQPILGNLKAIEIRQRYVEVDLNRCFSPANLLNLHPVYYEQTRAKEIADYLQDLKVDFLLDLHSTTAKMGLTLIVSNEHPFNLCLASYLISLYPSLKIYQPQPEQSKFYLRSLCELGFAIEVGAVAQGVLDAQIFQQTEALIYSILDYIEQWNQGIALPLAQSLTVYQQLAIIDYPRDEQGNLQGMIHPNLQGRDYEPLFPDEPLFLCFDDTEICYQGESVVYPVFINEAAYYEKGIALYFTQKKEIDLRQFSL